MSGLVLLCVSVVGCGDNGYVQADGPAPLHHSFSSLDELGRAVLDGVADADVEALRQLALSELEFRTVVWPELPSSRPERGLPFDYAWGDLNQKSTNELRRLVHYRGGQRFELVEMEFLGETTIYETYVVHRDSQLVVRDDEGGTRRVRFFGSVLERDGEFKLFSYVVD